MSTRNLDLAQHYLLDLGATMVGPFTLAGSPTADLMAATKAYVDTKVAQGGGSPTGFPEAPIDGQTYGRRGQSSQWLPVAPLDGTGKVPYAYLPAAQGTLQYRGGWNVVSNTPVLANGGLAGGVKAAKGDYFVALVGGTASPSIDGITTVNAGDWIVSNGNTWERQQNSAGVYLPIAGGTLTGALTGPSYAITGGATFTSFSAPTIPTRQYEYVWYDPNQRIAGGILADGSFAWSTAAFSSFSAATLTVSASAAIPRLTGSTLIDNLTASAFSPTSMTIGGNTFGVLDPRVPGYVYAWYGSANGIAAGIDTAGTFKIGAASINYLTLNTDPVNPTDAVRLSYFTSHALTTAGGTLTGPLFLASDPTGANPMQAATQQYVLSVAASGGGGGLTGLRSQRDFPYPPLRDPKRDYGAIGNGITDDSSPINACVADALAAGERAIAINDPFACPNLDKAISQLLLIGTGSLIQPRIAMFVVPPWAPAAPVRLPNQTLSLRAHCPKFATKLRAQTGSDTAPVVVITGESTYAPSTSPTVLPLIWARAQFAIKEANPGKRITFYNRAIGGQRWQQLDTVPVFGGDGDSAVSWYTDVARPWIEYIRDLAPDVVMIGFSGNDGAAYRLQYMLSVLTKFAGFANPPEIILATSNPYAQQYQTTANTASTWEAQQAAAAIERTWALSKGLGLLDTSRAITIHAKGFDPADMPLKRDFAVTGGQVNARKQIALPFTWPTRVWGYSAMFYIAANGWATLGNELQFDLGMTQGGGTWPNQTPSPSNAGCILRIGRDTTSGQMYYEVDTSLVSYGATQDSVHIPKTLIPWNKPTTDTTSFTVSVVGSRVIIQSLPGSSVSDDQWTAFVMVNVPRYNQPWFPKITSTSGTAGNVLWFEKSGDAYAYAASATPDQRAFYMPSMTEHEAYGGNEIPEASWAGGGVGHDSALKGIWALQCAVNSCDWSA